MTSCHVVLSLAPWELGSLELQIGFLYRTREGIGSQQRGQERGGPVAEATCAPLGLGRELSSPEGSGLIVPGAEGSSLGLA